jgi:hypothetical protein
VSSNPLSEVAGKAFEGVGQLIMGLLIAVIVLLLLGGGGAFWAYSYGRTSGEKLGRDEAACEAKKGTLKEGQCTQTVIIP